MEVPNGRTQQGGVFYYWLCSDCNNKKLGKWYAPEYIRWAQGGMGLIDGFPQGQRQVLVTPEKAYPLRLIKQVAAMFLIINPLDF